MDIDTFSTTKHNEVELTETLLDNIDFSEDENTEEKQNFVLTPKTYEEEMAKINQLYSNKPVIIDEDDNGTMHTYTGTKHEMEDRKELPIPFQLSSNDILIPSGKVDDIVEGKILMSPYLNPKIINLDNIVFNSNKIPIGFIDDVIGNISEPIYVVRIYPDLLDKNLALNRGEEWFLCQNKTNYVDKEKIQKMPKGCDASNAFDEEISADEMEFSDDNEEIQARALRRNKKRNGENGKKRKWYENGEIQGGNIMHNISNILGNSSNVSEQHIQSTNQIAMNTTGNEVDFIDKMMGFGMGTQLNPFVKPETKHNVGGEQTMNVWNCNSSMSNNVNQGTDNNNVFNFK